MTQPDSLEFFPEEICVTFCFSYITLLFPYIILLLQTLVFDPLGPTSTNSLSFLQPIPSQIPIMETRVAAGTLCRQDQACVQYLWSQGPCCWERTSKTAPHIQSVTQEVIGIVFFPISVSLCSINILCSFVLYLLQVALVID